MLTSKRVPEDVSLVEILCQGLARGLRHHRHMRVAGVADGHDRPGARPAEGGDLRAREGEVDELDRGRLGVVHCLVGIAMDTHMGLRDWGARRSYSALRSRIAALRRIRQAP